MADDEMDGMEKKRFGIEVRVHEATKEVMVILFDDDTGIAIPPDAFDVLREAMDTADAEKEELESGFLRSMQRTDGEVEH